MHQLRALPLALVTVVAVVAVPFTTSAATPRILVSLTPGGAGTESAALRAAGGRLVDAELRLWSLDASAAATLVPRLRARHALGIVQPVRTYETAAMKTTAVDPYSGQEWWLTHVGINGITPPGPGIPVTIVDSGVSLGHPEFANRPNLTALNPQDPAPLGGVHGTAVASLVGAPENGAGIVGIYPQAVLRSWDTAPGNRNLDSTEIVNGILAAARAGRGVINLSLGGATKDLAIDLAISRAVALDSLIVVASGNDGDKGSPLSYPAADPHVLTVAATDRSDQVVFFSSRSSFVDLAAPGDEMLVADAQSDGWTTGAGTSYATPLVSGAAAWVWTMRPDLDAGQVAEVVRRSARDIGAPGRDPESGFGLLNVAAALAYPTPTRNPGEPNDDTDEVDPAGDRTFSTLGPLTTRTRSKGALSATLDRWEDPRDVYRIWLPARKTVDVGVTSSTDNDLALYRAGTPTILGRFVSDFRLARAQLRGKTDRLTYANAATGRWAYLAVTLPKGVNDASYRITVR